jgi:NADP-dependent 3-hydroxy acid dehydrogenase YdfG
MEQLFNVTDRVAPITGAASGIGFAMQRLVRGLNVVPIRGPDVPDKIGFAG